MSHLFLAVTAHGYGHLAQAAPVIHELARRFPGLRITLQSDIDPGLARSRLPPGLTQIQEATDIGLLMDGPLGTRWSESLIRYADFEADYERRLARETSLLRREAPDLVLADVPWLPLDAARRAGIPAVALCSLNWYDILLESPVADQLPAPVMERMRAVYAAAERFIRPAPSMPMSWLPNAIDVGPIASRYPDRRKELRSRCGVPPDRPIALMQFGGFQGFDPLAMWPEQDQVHWLVQDLPAGSRRDATGISSLGLRVPDVMSSCDLMLCKPGYGTYSEAAVNRIPVLYVRRGDWPEEAALIPWLAERMPTREVTREDLLAGHLAEAIHALRTADRPPAVEPTGIEEVADLLEPLLEHGSRRAGHASRLGSADWTGTSSVTSVVDGS
ncbi:hypothetical protein [Thiocapsa sp. UBA6158]|jgi:hypothetical protein|uniref:hypothetical protein n=1 Tax=Thiocapsa sp. UBA6158 TaxID=1947692 RepID=UPI0025E79748|nr:hypothetical protein [Thiocapsa sp. UBA6158]